MRVLVLGGTEFLGRHVVNAALDQGDEVTIFNRGTRPVQWRRAVEQITGDRLNGLLELRNRRWDVVVDSSGYLPTVVSLSAMALRDAVDQYVFISTVSVYANEWKTKETSELATLTPSQLAAAQDVKPPSRSVAGGGYGPAYPGLKAACEGEVLSIFGSRSLIVRPGFIIGPNDYSPRWPYWVSRGMTGGDILAPGAPLRRTRVIDARDIADWILRMALMRQGGAFNATGADALSMEDLVNACAGLSPQCRVHWIPEEWLLKAGVKPFADIPFWMPEDENALLDVRNDLAVANGLTFRPLRESAKDTTAWLQEIGGAGPHPIGLDRARERSLIAEWLGRTGNAWASR